jgi:hypothetical protein
MVQTFSVEDVLNLVEPRLYFVAWLNDNGSAVFDVAERGGVLAVFPSVSVKVFDVEIRPLRGEEPPQSVLEHPRVKRLVEAVGRPPSLRMFEYTFVPLKTVVAERLDGGAEFRKVVEEPAAPAVTIRAAHAYYSVYVDDLGHVHERTSGGAKALRLVVEGKMRRPEVYTYCRGRRCEVGVRIPVGEARQLIEYLAGP